MGIFDRLDQLADQLGDLIVPEDVRLHVELGAAYLDRGDLDAAVRELTLAVELKPDHARASYLLGVAQARRGADEEAAVALGRAAGARGGFAEAHLALGEVHRRRGDTEAAADAFRAALDAGLHVAALRGEAYRGLGAVYLEEGRYDKAVRELRKAVASIPDLPEIQGLLGRALLLRGDVETARVCLERAARAPEPDAAALISLGELYQRQGRFEQAEEVLQRALERGGATCAAARLGLARLALANGRVESAREQVTRALESEPDRPDLLVELGRVEAAADHSQPALDAFDRALASTAAGHQERLLWHRRAVQEEALGVALRAGLFARAEAYAAALLADDPAHPLALAAAARAAAARNELERAEELVASALAVKDSVETRLAAADVALERGQLAGAAAALRRAAELDATDPRPRARLAEVYRRERDPAPTDLYSLLQGVHRHFARCRELAELSPEAGRLRELLDRPLLVTVMGEFNSGKSTFVNALLGEEVAPMGITPTTATINVLKYGAEPGGRVVYLDDSARDIAWAQIPELLKRLAPDEAKRIALVEVLYPLETLSRVNVVDTPGLNSIHPEHEETARRFIAEADAVVWLFTAAQAAKATEAEILGRIRAEGKKVLGVINKIDRASPDELAEVVAHVEAALGEQLEAVVPFSAREALVGRRQSDAARLAASNFAALERVLEERFFSQARAIKREASRTRLAALLARAHAIAERLLAAQQLDPVVAALAAVRADAVRFSRDFLALERRRLQHSLDELFADCAREVLDFVRPRRWRFGSNEAAPADRDFLLSLLDERLGALLESSRQRVVDEIQRSVAAAAEVAPGVELGDFLVLLDEQVYGRYRAFARGYLRGGRVDDFFTRVLPKLELSEPEIRRALERDMPFTDDIMEAELRTPLKLWAERLAVRLVERLERQRSAVELERLELEERMLAPLELFQRALDAMLTPTLTPTPTATRPSEGGQP